MDLVHVCAKLELSFRAMFHFIDKSVARWQTLSVRKSTSGWPHPLLMSSSIIPIGSCQVSCHPCLASTILVHCLTHPLVPLVTDGGRWDSHARSEVWSGLSLPWPCALPLLFSSPSSTSHPPDPSVTSIKSSAIHSSHRQACFIAAFTPLHSDCTAESCSESLKGI